MWKKLLSVVALFTMLATQTAFAAIDGGIPTSGTTVVSPVKSLTITPSTFDPSDGEKATVRLEVTEASVATVKVLSPTTGSALITLDSSITLDSTNSYTYTKVFAGRLSDGSVLPDGSYMVNAAVYPVSGSGSINKTVNFVVDSDDEPPVLNECTVKSNGVIEDAEVDPCVWNPDNEDLEITWDLDDDVDDFTLTAEKSGEDDIELMDEEDLDEDSYDFEWDGTDEDGDEIEEGTWYIVFEADDDEVSIPVVVDYDADTDDDDDDDDDNDGDVEITNIFVSKTSFDNEIDEFSYVVFRLDDDAEVTVEVLDGSKEVVTLMDGEDLDGDVWHAVKWDGMDDDDDEVDEGDYKFKVIAEDDDNDKTSKTVTVEVEEDDVSSNRTNVTKDSISPVVIDKDSSNGGQITYKLDDDAEVTVAIYKGDKTSGAEIVLENKKDKKAGTYTIKWDGRDDDDDKLDRNTKYSYLVTAKVDGSSTKVDKERGYFVIGEPGEIDGGKTTNYTCSGSTGFWDVSTSSPYCEAIVWARERGIIDGYRDGSFRQYNFINRVEALKVALKAFNLPILYDNYTNLGFTDVQVGAWYMPYLRTGKFYGMIAGYGGTTLVKPASEISRVEILKYVLEAAETSQDYDIPVCNSIYYSDTNPGVWYSDYVCLSHDYDLFQTYSGYFYPGVKATRGEVVLVLYKLYQAGLLN